MNRPGPMPSVCVVMPLFNKRDFVQRAVASVLNQSLADLELIVVDDGSTDGGGEIVRQIRDPRLRVIRTENRGPGAARNVGAAASEAPWIALLDADDEWLLTFLEVTLAAAHRDPRTVAVFTEVAARGATTPVRDVRSGPIEDYFAARMRHGIAVSSSSVLIRRTAYQSCGGFRENYRYAEDIETWLRLSSVGPFYFVAEPLCRIEVASAARLTRVLDHRERAEGLRQLDESFQAQLRARAIPEAQIAACRRFMEHQRGQQAVHLALAGERMASVRVLRRVPLGRHTWRDYAAALRCMLRPQASPGRSRTVAR